LQLQASSSSIAKFGGLEELGLQESSSMAGGTAARKPVGFKPAMICGMVGATTPVEAVSPISGRRVIRYSAGAGGSAKANFAAPISGATDTTQRTLFSAIVEAKAAAFNAGEGGYGRLWFTPEYLSTSE
jgi:hypothetical protein